MKNLIVPFLFFSLIFAQIGCYECQNEPAVITIERDTIYGTMAWPDDGVINVKSCDGRIKQIPQSQVKKILIGKF